MLYQFLSCVLIANDLTLNKYSSNQHFLILFLSAITTRKVFAMYARNNNKLYKCKTLTHFKSSGLMQVFAKAPNPVDTP